MGSGEGNPGARETLSSIADGNARVAVNACWSAIQRDEVGPVRATMAAMTMRSMCAALVICAALVASACGTSGTTTGAGGDAGTEDGGNPPGCPAAEPNAGTPCAQDGLSCSYGQCREEHASCANGVWNVAATDHYCPATPKCEGAGGRCTCGATCPPGSVLTGGVTDNGCPVAPPNSECGYICCMPASDAGADAPSDVVTDG